MLINEEIRFILPRKPASVNAYSNSFSKYLPCLLVDNLHII